MAKDVYTVADLRDWATAIVGETPPVRLSVFGDPVAHSRSPQMHNPALEAAGIEAAYVRVHVSPEELKEAAQLLPQLGFFGTNVTIPHKAAMLGLMDEVDSRAQAAGGVNTVVVDGEKLIGFSTDGPGFVRAIRADFGADVRDLRIMVLGAGGGAGTAISVECAMEKASRLVLVNRSYPRAVKLAEKLRGNVETALWEEATLARLLPEIDLIINATPLGMAKEGLQVSPIPASMLRPTHLVYDTVYTTGRTSLLMAADEAGARGADGLSMLLYQGALSFEIWFGQPAPVDVMRTALIGS